MKGVIKRNEEDEKVIVILIIIIIILAAAILINLFLHKNYLTADTFEDVRYVYNYENLKSAKGEPVREMAVGIAEDDQIWLVVYDDITVEYMYIPEKNMWDTFCGRKLIMTHMCLEMKR